MSLRVGTKRPAIRWEVRTNRLIVKDFPVPTLQSSVIEPLWSQFAALIPPVEDHHPLGCNRRRVPDRIVFDKLVDRLVLGGAYHKHADDRVSATTLRTRRDEWIKADLFTRLEQIVLEAFDQVIGLALHALSVDGCCVKAPCGGDNTGPNPTDRGKTGQKRSVLVEGHDIPIGVVLAGANTHDSPLLAPTVETLSRFGFFLPENIRVDLDAGYDSQKTRDTLTRFGCEWKISPKGQYIEINHTRRWKIERTNAWHTRGFSLLQVVLDRHAPVQNVWVALAGAIIALKQLLQHAWFHYRWDTRPVKPYTWR